MKTKTRRLLLIAPLLSVPILVYACATQDPLRGERHRWWSGLGPVLPHESFPTDCKLCHQGGNWNRMREDFAFDHLRETGVALEGAHNDAKCLRCHNDRGPVAVFDSRGCAGCHEDFHYGDLGPDCTSCHTQETWRPYGQFELHQHTRFPLVGAHVGVACYRCHPGAEVGNFIPTDTECVTCHQDDLRRTTNHIGLGWTNRCDRCHIPTRWQQAEID